MRFAQRTLISRIVWTTLIVTAVAMAAMVVTVMLVLSALTNKNIDARLRDQLTAVSSTVEVGTDGNLTALETPNDTVDDTTWVYAADGTLVEGPHVGKRLTSTADSLSGVRKQTRLDRDERSFLAAPVRRGGKVEAVVVVEAPLEPYESTRNLTLLGLLVLAVTVTGGSAAIAAWTVKRTLGPVESMAARARDWSEHDLEARFDTTAADDEFGRLGRTLNVLLDRVAGALRSEQQLTSELAHELRTPLTAIRGEAELTMMTSPSPDVAERLVRIVDLVDRMSTTISSLLAIARNDPRLESRMTAADLVEAVLEHRPDRPALTVSRDGLDGVEMSVPAELAVRALAPIVDNAFTHARTSVEFRAAAHERVVEITVSDDGDGISVDDPESVFRSGARGSESHGAGLGLALSRRVARTLGGDVRITSADRPTSFTLTLPRTT
jgi:signal transduction histidine kinase